MPKWRWKELCRILSAPSVQLKGYSTGQWHRAARSGQGGPLCDRPHDPWRPLPPKNFHIQALNQTKSWDSCPWADSLSGGVQSCDARL